jgi:catechol-2,3-dioxygenase
VLGFRLTDSVEDKRHWLRCGPNHHTVAVFEGPDGLQHYAFATEDMNQLGRLGDLLATRGEQFIWGLGRHGLGANMFSYHLDPAGGVLEVCCGMIQVEDEEAWVAQVWRADTLDSAVMWGPPPPSEFRQLGIPTRAGVRQ